MVFSLRIEHVLAGKRPALHPVRQLRRFAVFEALIIHCDERSSDSVDRAVFFHMSCVIFVFRFSFVHPIIQKFHFHLLLIVNQHVLIGTGISMRYFQHRVFGSGFVIVIAANFHQFFKIDRKAYLPPKTELIPIAF